MTASRDALFARLDALKIAHRTVDHPPIMTVEEGRAFKADMPGGHSKNLFLRDKKGAHYLLSAHCDTPVDLVALGKAIGARGRLSFGKPAAMEATLGVTPGAVTPFGLMNAPPGAFTRVVVDRRFFDFDPVWFHPLDNAASTAIAPADLVRFAEACGFAPLILDPAAPLDEAGVGGARG